MERRCHGAKGCLAGVEQQAARLVERESLLGCRRIQCRLASAEQSVAQLAYCSDGVEQSADDQLVRGAVLLDECKAKPYSAGRTIKERERPS